MATLYTDEHGGYCVQFRNPTGPGRKTIRLGKVSKTAGKTFETRVEKLVNAARVGDRPDPETVAWVRDLPDETHQKLVAVGLAEPRRGRQLRAVVDDFITALKADGKKPTTIVTYERPAADLIQFLGGAANVRDITPAVAEKFKEHLLLVRELESSTVYYRLKRLRTVFKRAVRLGVVDANPFADVTCRNTVSADRKHYVPAAHALKIMATAPPPWPTIVALSRFGGLRAPNEVLLLRWRDVDFARGSMTFRSPKTEHHQGGDERTIPLFPVLRKALEEARAGAEPDAVFVVAGKMADKLRATAEAEGWQRISLGTLLVDRIYQAGLDPWPKPLHNMRASCETDLAQRYPLKDVVGWIGNTVGIAMRHYLMETDETFARAVADEAHGAAGAESGATPVQNPVRTGAARNGPDRTPSTEPVGRGRVSPLVSGPVLYRPDAQMAKVGLIPPADSPTIPGTSRGEAGQPVQNPVQPALPFPGVQPDPYLTVVAAAWPTLPEHVRLAVLALVRSQGKAAA